MLEWMAEYSRILLVGEGNFSFTIALLTKIMNAQQSIQVLSSCYQKYIHLSESEKQNAKEANRLGKPNFIKYLKSYLSATCDYLTETGAEIWFDVDATQLSLHERISFLKFDVIIFNFPHIGGKMKIHLNKALLREFFKSASCQLADNGQILVSLCKGQSGTCYDSAQRKFSDSWQVITMATFGDLVLRHVAPFNMEDWPGYYCKGYRSLDKQFHIEGAMTYTFAKSLLNISSIPLRNIFISYDSLHCNFIASQLVKFTKNSQMFPEVLLFHSFFLHKGLDLKITESLTHICLCSETPKINLFGFDAPDFTLVTVLLCRPCHSHEIANPVERIIVFSFPNSEEILVFMDFLKVRCRICSTSDPTVVEYWEESNQLKIITVIRQERSRLLIHLDAFIRLITNFPHNLDFPVEFQLPVKSLYPPKYQHHLSFWIPPNFSRPTFACILYQIADPLIRSIRLIDEFKCETSNRQSLCYEIVYQSLEGSLSPDRVWDLHINVIGKTIEQHLGVVIR